jgi:hypothetical protein
MGGGSNGDPAIGPTEDSDSSNSGEDDAQLTEFDDQPPEENLEEPEGTQAPSGGALTGGGAGASSASAPPITEQPPTEESELREDEGQEPEAPHESDPPGKRAGYR